MYTLTYSDNRKPLQIIKDYEKDEITDLAFYGKGSSNYGKDIWNNFLYLMENFCNTGYPSDPLEGQLFYNNVDHVLKIRRTVGDRLIQSTDSINATSKLINDFDALKQKLNIV
jgi:hypothetical protein